jgi:hypothetical protein
MLLSVSKNMHLCYFDNLDAFERYCSSSIVRAEALTVVARKVSIESPQLFLNYFWNVLLTTSMPILSGSSSSSQGRPE